MLLPVRRPIDYLRMIKEITIIITEQKQKKYKKSGRLRYIN